MWEALGGAGELVKGSVVWESRVPPPKGRFHFRSSYIVCKKRGTGLQSGEGPVPAETRRVHPGVKEGDAGRKGGPLGPGREEIGS